MSATTLHALVVVTVCNLHWWCFSAASKRKYSTGTCGGYHQQLALVVVYIYIYIYGYEHEAIR